MIILLHTAQRVHLAWPLGNTLQGHLPNFNTWVLRDARAWYVPSYWTKTQFKNSKQRNQSKRVAMLQLTSIPTSSTVQINVVLGASTHTSACYIRRYIYKEFSQWIINTAYTTCPTKFLERISIPMLPAISNSRDSLHHAR